MPKIRQTNGALQGDPIGPLMFNIATGDITDIVKNASHTKLIMYAVDMMLRGTNQAEVLETLQNLKKWTEENGLHINMEKTFRRGGRPAKEDTLQLNNEPLEIVNKFKLSRHHPTNKSNFIPTPRPRENNSRHQSYI